MHIYQNKSQEVKILLGVNVGKDRMGNVVTDVWELGTKIQKN